MSHSADGKLGAVDAAGSERHHTLCKSSERQPALALRIGGRDGQAGIAPLANAGTNGSWASKATPSSWASCSPPPLPKSS